MKYVCSVCGYVYDEQKGDKLNHVHEGTQYDDLPEGYVCPMCGVEKERFTHIGQAVYNKLCR
ncbi:MAG: rubredoxin [Lachnospiraceae bacterium]|nr:rubredoxin [Lachnospiraceae bacterium]